MSHKEFYFWHSRHSNFYEVVGRRGSGDASEESWRRGSGDASEESWGNILSVEVCWKSEKESERVKGGTKCKFCGIVFKPKDGNTKSNKSLKMLKMCWNTSVNTRLLHPHHLDGIWTGQTPYRLPYNTLYCEYPEPCSWKNSGRGKERTYNF